MQACTEYSQLYQNSHTCKAGECIHCHRYFKGIREHKCPVTNMSTMLPISLWRSIKDDAPTCDGCGAKHFRTKHLHGFRRYKSVDLCDDCFFIPEIENATSKMYLRLTMLDVRMGKTSCTICNSRLIDPVTGHVLAAFLRDYVDLLDTQCSVWALVNTGAEWDSVQTANEQCRNVCIRCHSAISKAKWVIGIQGLKKLQVSDCVKDMAVSKVESLVHMLVFHGAGSL